MPAVPALSPPIFPALPPSARQGREAARGEQRDRAGFGDGFAGDFERPVGDAVLFAGGNVRDEECPGAMRVQAVEGTQQRGARIGVEHEVRIGEASVGHPGAGQQIAEQRAYCIMKVQLVTDKLWEALPEDTESAPPALVDTLLLKMQLLILVTSPNLSARIAPPVLLVGLPPVSVTPLKLNVILPGLLAA